MWSCPPLQRIPAETPKQTTPTEKPQSGNCGSNVASNDMSIGTNAEQLRTDESTNKTQQRSNAPPNQPEHVTDKTGGRFLADEVTNFSSKPSRSDSYSPTSTDGMNGNDDSADAVQHQTSAAAQLKLIEIQLVQQRKEYTDMINEMTSAMKRMESSICSRAQAPELHDRAHARRQGAGGGQIARRHRQVRDSEARGRRSQDQQTQHRQSK